MGGGGGERREESGVNIVSPQVQMHTHPNTLSFLAPLFIIFSLAECFRTTVCMCNG